MKIEKTKLPGVFILEPDVFTDARGSLVKPFHRDTLMQHGLVGDYAESFLSTSKKGVIRGMHFQVPPQDHVKLVYVPSGAIRDVVVDIRKGSPTFGEHIAAELSADNHKMLYIPRGCAHGFLSLADGSQTVYLQETMRSAEHEGGIRFDSFGMDWGAADPILSDRDRTFPALADYESPFFYST